MTPILQSSAKGIRRQSVPAVPEVYHLNVSRAVNGCAAKSTGSAQNGAAGIALLNSSPRRETSGRVETFPVLDDLKFLLDEIMAPFVQEPSVELVNELALRLAALHDRAKEAGRLHEFRRTCREHPISNIILEDPYTRRAFEKPRGYAGDAVMLDYIYKPGPIQASPVGAAVHAATTRLPNALSILWRRDYLARIIVETMQRTSARSTRILSVASGHMRELDRVRSGTEVRDVEIWALDQDKDSLDECVDAYPDFDIRPINTSIAAIFRGRLRGMRFDLIYSAGLADYLSDKTLEALLANLYGALEKGGLLTVGNFTPDSHGRGFMEGFMEWSLIYRDERDLVRAAEEALPGAPYKVFRDGPGNVSYVEICRNALCC